MNTEISREGARLRRLFLGQATAALVGTQLGRIGAAHAQDGADAKRRAESASQALFSSVKQVDAGVLSIGYADIGTSGAPPVLLLHGWPYDIHTYVDVAPLLATMGYRVIVPFLRGYGSTRFLSADTPRNGQQSVLALDAINLMNALRIDKAVIGGCDWGARTACIMAALWPERCKALVSVSGYLIGSREANRGPLPPEAELQWWYQFYFATERGKAGYEKNRRSFAKLIWRLASPQWDFGDDAFERTAAALDNPDHVAIAIHNYRWRLGLADGEAQFDPLEALLARAPDIGVPTITMEGDANGAPHPQPSTYAKKFVGKYEHRLVAGGTGHNLPQEAPRDFAAAIADVDRL